MKKMGVVGTGRMGGFHARNYMELGLLAGIYDVMPAVALAASEKFSCRQFNDLDQFFNTGGLDGISIATPTSTHYPTALKALESGLHVLIEKPICETESQAQELIDLAARKGLVLMVGHIERFNPVVEIALERIRDGAIGEPISISALRENPFPARIGDVGVIMDTAIHDIDLVRYLLGVEVKRVSAVASRNRHHLAEDMAHIILEFSDNKIGYIKANWMAARPRRVIDITGTDGTATLDLMARKLEICSSTSSSLGAVEIVEPEPREQLRGELQDFIRAMEEGVKPRVSGQDALVALKIARASIRSYTDGKSIVL